MTPPSLELEGTWEEIVAHADQLAGCRVRLTVLAPLARPAPPRDVTAAERDPERVARVRSIRGKFARPDGEKSSDVLHRERQRDREREEQATRGSRS